jgi:pimeloyl-ACP methyl ester carboxylesterase
MSIPLWASASAPEPVRPAVPHQAALPEAVDARRRNLETARSGRISYYDDVSAAGKPLVLVHSVNAAPSAFEMRPLFEHFRHRRPVYAPDLPGFGFSERQDRPYSPELFADALTQLLTEVVRGPADLVAFSLGAEFAARTALRLADQVESLVLISPTGLGKRPLPTAETGRRVHKALSLPVLSQGLYELLTTRVSIRYFLGQAFVGKTPPELIDYAYATSHQPGARHAPLYFLSMQLFTPNAYDELYARLELPVLALYDRDPNITFERLPELVSARRNWRAERIGPSLGLPHWEKTAETIAAMERFWGSEPGPA